MRTTVELTDAQRARLLKLAAERGDKGFSKLVQEAIDEYLEARVARDRRVEAAVAVLGSLDDSAAEALYQTVVDLRARWR